MHTPILFRRLFALCLIAVLAFSATPGMAQTASAACPALVKQAVQDLQTGCSGLLPGNACYGHKGVETTFTSENQAPAFDAPGNQAPLTMIQALHTMPLDLASGQLGAVALSLGSVNADASVSSAASALLFGDVTLKIPATTPSQSMPPAQSLFFRSAFTAPACDEARSQFVIRSAANKPLPLTLNGADLTLNALAVFRWESANSISATVYQGSLAITGGPTGQAGQTLVAVVDNDGNVVLWSAPRPATAKESAALDPFSQMSGSLATFVNGCTQDDFHVVVAGDTLYRLSLRYQTSVDVLMAANGITNPNLIVVGQRLRIPCKNNPAPVAAAITVKTPVPAPSPVPGGPTQVPGPTPCYVAITVGPDTNLAQIAQRYGTSVAAILAANNLSNWQMSLNGLRLYIPCG